MNTMIRKFLKEEDGITAIEYGVLAAVVVAAIVAVFGAAGTGGLRGLFNTIFTNLTTAVNAA
jgi:pilus assembly protein Flp/PilA